LHPTAAQLRNKFAQRQSVLGTFLLEFTGPAVVHCLADAGMDFALIDLEHGNQSTHDVETMIEAGLHAELAIFVRVPSVDRGLITRSLDAGAAGILVPAIRSMDQVHQVVEATKYKPIGRRGVHLFRGHTRHRPVETEKFLEEANRDLFTMIQIELVDALAIVDEIAATEGVDGLYVGPGDLGVDLGVPGQWGAPPIWEAIERTANACQVHGKIMGCHYDFPEHVPKLAKSGVQMFGYYCDIALFKTAAAHASDTFHETLDL